MKVHLLACFGCSSAVVAIGVQMAAAQTQFTPIPQPPLSAVTGLQYEGDGLSVSQVSGGVRLRCVFQRLEGQATRDGLWLASSVEGQTGEKFRVMARAVGREGARCALSDHGDVAVVGKVVRFVRPGFTEEYSASMDGVQQDFIVERRPAGAGDLRLELSLNGASAEPCSAGAQLLIAGSARKLAYHRLLVTDAHGRDLSARIEVVSQRQLAIMVDDADATYPVRIDPTFSDADWISIAGLPGPDSTVLAAAFDASGNLYIGGTFTVVGNVVANRIAKWDGDKWSDLNGGLSGTVNAIAISGGNVYAGGAFATAEDGNLTNGIIISVNSIAKWNGSEWSALDAGVIGNVNAIAVSGSDVYVAGTFTSPASRIAKWDGLSWSALGSGVGGAVNALAVIGTDVYAGGTFTSPAIRIAKWNGSTWSALSAGIGGGTSPSVNALAVMGTNLYASGTFTIAGALSPANNIAKWDGITWSSVGAGLGGTANSMAVSGSDLYVSGAFAAPASRIAKWDGANWSALGSGANGTVNAVATYGSTVAAGGSFTTTPATRLAAWNGTAWSGFGAGLNGPVGAIAINGYDVYFGGSFVFRGVPGAVNIVRWNGLNWSALASGLNGGVSALATSGTDLYAGGTFTTATNTGGATVTVNRIAKWNGNAWSALDAGMNNAVSALATAGNDLYAGGSFSSAGPISAYNIARWNGSSWSPLAGGVSTAVSVAVKALAVSGNDLYAAGEFTMATNSGGVSVPAARIAKWDGNAWSALGTGMDNPVSALAVSGSTLYAGGFFNNAGGTAVGRIAQWNGNSWSALGFATNNIFVNSLAASGSDLFVGGTFSQIGPMAANNIAQWDGNTWTTLGSGVSGTSIPAVNALAATDGNLYVGGSFFKAGDKGAGYVAKANVSGAALPGRFVSANYSPIAGLSCTFLDASPGQNYRIQTSPTLAIGSWTDATNFNYAGPVGLAFPPIGGETNNFIRAVTP